MPRKLVTLLAATAVAGGISFATAAEPSAEDAKDYRVAVMTTLRGHIGAASMIVRGLVEDRGFLVAHAEGLEKGASELAHVFQEGSDVGESEALPAIWENPDEFAAAVEEAQKATRNFREVVAGGGDKGEIAAAFREVGGSCKGCHDSFRVDD
ncbi:MAG: cytochrome c [Woeseiaceae bacterium]|nr:cytochrome c [Woeseiaceae bacterium]